MEVPGSARLIRVAPRELTLSSLEDEGVVVFALLPLEIQQVTNGFTSIR